MRAWRSWRGQLAAVLLLIAASTVGLAIHVGKPGGTKPATSPNGPASPVPPPFPDCTGDSSPRWSSTGVQQKTDGTFTACLRAGMLSRGSYFVSLHTLAGGVRDLGIVEPNTSIALSPAHGPPGSLVTVTGFVGAVSPDQRQPDHVPVCWDGCAALVDMVEVRWSTESTGHFSLQFQVPAAPWREERRVHPLAPGSYPVILPCIGGLEKPSGRCAGVQLQASFQLDGPAWTLCADGRPCELLEVNPTEGPPGSVIAVRGWVPLVGLDGHGFLNLDLRASLTPPATKPGYANAVPLLAWTSFLVTVSPTWASLGTLHPVSILRTGMEAIGVDPSNPNRFAYCSQAGIRLTTDGGRTWSTISLKSAYATSNTTNYPFTSNYTGPTCGSVALDPRHPASFYAMFSTVPRNSGPPPSYFVAYFTGNTGHTWQPVPVPAGSDMGAFGGFRVDSTAVRVLYFTPGDTYGDHPAFVVQETSDGGRSWSVGSLGCPAAGPCVALGPQTNARCMAVEEWEAVEVSADHGASWSSTNQVGACWRTVEVVGLADGRLLTLDGSGQFPLITSDDGDRTWHNIELPRRPGETDVGLGLGPNIELLPDGRLLSVAGQWSVLQPGASAWCVIPRTPVANPNESPAPALIGDRLWWLDRWPPALHSLPLAAVHC